MGSVWDWYQQIRHRNVTKNPIENVQLFISTGKLVAKAKPRPKSVVNLSSNCAPACERNPQPFYHSCFAVSKFMTRSLRHSSIHREEDGEVRFYDLFEKLKEIFTSTLHWAVSEFSFKRRRKEEKMSILLESLCVQ